MLGGDEGEEVYPGVVRMLTSVPPGCAPLKKMTTEF